MVRTINWNSDAASAETFHAMPLPGRNNELLGVLLVGSSRRQLVLLTNRIVMTSAAVAAGALLVGLLVSFWVSARITRPVRELADGSREVAAGRWDTRIDVRGLDEIGQLGIAFNDMTRTLAIQDVYKRQGLCLARNPLRRQSFHRRPACRWCQPSLSRV